MIKQKMTFCISRLGRLLANYTESRCGAFAIYAAFALPAVIAAVGMAVDLGRVQLEEQRISHALDAAGLAAASSQDLGPSQREARMRKFFNRNYSGESGSISDISVTMTMSGPDNRDITITAETEVKTLLMAIVGIDTVPIEATSKVTRRIAGLEVALVLDVTGSMRHDMQELKTASLNFIDIFDDSIEEDDLGFIGIVPYWTHVSVGPYGIGENPDGTIYQSGDPFVELPSDVTYAENPDGPFEWGGVVMARMPDEDITDFDLTTPLWDVPSSPVQSGETTGWLHISGSCSDFGTLGICSGANITCSPSKFSGWKRCTADSAFRVVVNSPNRTSIRPLTSMGQRADLEDTILSLTADGRTNINIGAVWGWRVLSPKRPFTEGKAYDNNMWEKVAVIMTDGQSNEDDAYPDAAGSINTSDRLKQTCQNMKAEGVKVYTIGFGSNTNVGLLQDCASPGNYFDAGNDLVSTFEDIAQQISQLHISQ